MKIEQARLADAQALTELTLRSKAYWNYSADQIEKWRDDLTITEEYLSENSAFILKEHRQLIGYYSFMELNNGVVKLDNLFIEPLYIGKGWGSILMQHFMTLAQDRGFRKIKLDSEPQASQFYKKFGFSVVGQLKSSIKDRYLPIMELILQ